MSHPSELAVGLNMPVQMYPLMETAIRARHGRSVHEQQVLSAELWARFSDVAVTNPWAWSRHRWTAAEIATASDDNRIIGYPYTKLMNSNENVNMGAALLICSAERAAVVRGAP